MHASRYFRILPNFSTTGTWARRNYGWTALTNWLQWFKTSSNLRNLYLDSCDSLKMIRSFAQMLFYFWTLFWFNSFSSLQILLLKTGSFELAIIRMSRLMDLSQNAVLYGDVMLSQDVFYTSNTMEMKLVAGIFETAKSIAELKLTETELALYQSLVLLWPGKNAMNVAHFSWELFSANTWNNFDVNFAERPGVRGNTEIFRLFNMSMAALKQELEANHAPLKGDVTVLDTLLNKIPSFKWVQSAKKNKSSAI